MAERSDPLALALDLVSEGAAVIGLDLRVRYANRAYAARMGIAPEELIGMDVARVLGNAFAVAAPRMAAALAGQPQDFEVFGPAVRGSARFRVRYQPVTGASGVVDSFVLVLSEVTEAATASAARADMEVNFTALFNAIQQGFAFHQMIRDEHQNPIDYRYLAVNPAFAEMTGVPVASWIGRTVREVLGGIEPFWLDTFGRVALEEVPIHLERHSAEIGRTFEVLAYPAGADRFAVLTRDVTDRNAREEAMRQGQRLESLGVLAGGIAHDFNNLLAAVLGNLNLAQLRTPADDPRSAYFERMETGLLRARDLVRQLLSYAGRARTERRPLDLGAVVRSMAELLRVSVSRRIALVVDIAPGLPAVLADEAQVQQVVLNLVTNASEAIGDTSGTVSLALTEAHLDAAFIAASFPGQVVQPGRYLRFTVADDGRGMAPEVASRIFEPYFSTKSAGRGLGLSALRGILTSHGAALALRTMPDEGTTFDVWFPALPDLVLSPPPARPAVNLTPGGVLLFVDDEKLLQATIPDMLRSLGFMVDAVESGEAAIACVRADPARYRGVLLDLTMPGLGGAETLPQLQALRADLPVLLCSGDRGRVNESGLPAGMPFLAKPYSVEGLRAALAALLG